MLKHPSKNSLCMRTKICLLYTSFGAEIISTGGTARALKDAGVPVTPIDDVTPVSYTHLDVYKRQVALGSPL